MNKITKPLVYIFRIGVFIGLSNFIIESIQRTIALGIILYLFWSELSDLNSK